MKAFLTVGDTLLYWTKSILQEASVSSKKSFLPEVGVSLPVDYQKHFVPIAICNPYRIRTQKDYFSETVGLRSSLLKMNSIPSCEGSHFVQNEDPLKFAHSLDDLVYRVYPLPDSLHNAIFDFGSINPDVETRYIKKMINNDLKMLSTESQKLGVFLCVKSHSFLRNIFGPECVSLRDVSRFTRVVLQVLNLINGMEFRNPTQRYQVCTVLALSYCYVMRLAIVMIRHIFAKELLL